MNDFESMKKTLANEEKRIEKLYYDLGKKYFALSDRNPIPELEEQLGLVKACAANIKELRSTVEDIRKNHICPNCSAWIEDDSIYCIMCGIKLKNDSENAVVAKERYCCSCGEPLSESAVFCGSCGAKQKR